MKLIATVLGMVILIRIFIKEFIRKKLNRQILNRLFKVITHPSTLPLAKWARWSFFRCQKWCSIMCYRIKFRLTDMGKGQPPPPLPLPSPIRTMSVFLQMSSLMMILQVKVNNRFVQNRSHCSLLQENLLAHIILQLLRWKCIILLFRIWLKFRYDSNFQPICHLPFCLCCYSPSLNCPHQILSLL